MQLANETHETHVYLFYRRENITSRQSGRIEGRAKHEISSGKLWAKVLEFLLLLLKYPFIF